jgi:hypothetical protein
MEKKIKYDNMIEKLELLQNEQKKIEFKIKRLKESIDEFETIHLFDNLDKIKKIQDDNEFM